MGQQDQSAGAAIPQYGYTGREPDATGLIYYRARYYDPSIGRFVSRDPAGMPDGVNRYAYVRNSPINFTDPSGNAAYNNSFTNYREQNQSYFSSNYNATPTSNNFSANNNVSTTNSKFQEWPTPGNYTLNTADKYREGDGDFGSPRSGGRPHTGIDILAPVGAPVVAVGAGVVIRADNRDKNGYGNQIIINHGGALYTQSGHLNSMNVEPKDQVQAGQVIGTVGRSGNTPKAGDTHLHFEVRIGSSKTKKQGGVVEDPLKYLPR